MTSIDELEKILREKLSADPVLVEDISGNCGTSFRVEVTSPDFVGVRLIERQRMVYDALGKLMDEIHALEVKCKLPK